MSLKRKFLAQNLLLALGLLLAAVASLWRLNVLRDEVAVSRYAYTELKTAQTTMLHIARAQGLLASPGADRAQVLDNLRQAAAGLDDFVRVEKEYAHDPRAAAAYAVLIDTAQRARGRLAALLGAMEQSPEPATPTQVAELDRGISSHIESRSQPGWLAM